MESEICSNSWKTMTKLKIGTENAFKSIQNMIDHIPISATNT